MLDVPGTFNVTTPNLGLNKPDVGGDDDIWGDLINANQDLLDALIPTYAKLTIADDPPSPPTDFWWDSDGTQLYIWFAGGTEGGGGCWVAATNSNTGGAGGGGNASVVLSATPPPNPTHAMLWATYSGTLFVYDSGLGWGNWIQITGQSS